MAMPPRRSSRAASTKPVSKPALKFVEKAPSQTSSAGGSNKRAASPERPSSPPAKRTRTETKKSENVPPEPPRKPASKDATAKPTARRPRAKLTPVPETPHAPPPQLKPYFNPLPTPPQRQRPAPLLFVWGTGNFGQFGMGPDFLDEQTKPKRNVWVEEQIEDGTFGDEGAGIESIAAGGLHTVFIDEKGTVCKFYLLTNNVHSFFIRCGLAVLTMTQLWAA